MIDRPAPATAPWVFSRACTVGLALVGLAVARPAAAGRFDGPLTPLQATVERSEIMQEFNWSMLAMDDGDMSSIRSLFVPGAGLQVFDAEPSAVPKAPSAAADGATASNRAGGATGREVVSKPASSAGSVNGHEARDHHFTSNVSIVFRDASHAILNGYVIMFLPGQGGGETGPALSRTNIPSVISSYDIELVKTGDQWLFSAYRLYHAGSNGGVVPLAH